MRRLPVLRARKKRGYRTRLNEARESAGARGVLARALDHLDRALVAESAGARERCWHEVDLAYDAIDAYLELLSSAAQLPVSCSAGCSACCTETPPVHALEGLRMARALLSRTDGRARVQRAVEQARRFQALMAAHLRRRGGSGDAATTRTEVYREAQEAWRRLGQPCPVLGDDGRCAEYRARPLACRIYVIVDDPARCDPKHPGFKSLQRPALWSSGPEREFERKLAQLGAQLGLPAVPNLQWAVARLHDHAE